MREKTAALGLGVLLVLSACTSRVLEATSSDMTDPDVRTDTRTFAAATNRDVDILFVVDGAPPMAKPQAHLRAAFPAFIDALAALPGGLPDLHIAVVSSDLGAGMGLDPNCVGYGDGALLQPTTARDCETTIRDGQRFIANIGGAPNYAAPIDQVFGCLTTMRPGCGFGQPLLSLTRALGADNFDHAGRAQPPPENGGFLRDDAALAVVILSNQDDCSVSTESAGDLFGDTDAQLSSALGPAQRYRCNEFGHLCGSPLAPPPRLAPSGDVNAEVTLDGCVPAELAGKLIPVTSIATVIKALKPDPENEILVAAVTGPTDPYTVSWRAAPKSDSGPWPMIEHACVTRDGSFADPAVRVNSLVERFGRNGVLRSICEHDLTPALTDVAGKIGRTMGAKRCVTERFADHDGDPSNGVQLDCAATDLLMDAKGGVHGVALPACAQVASGERCWRFADDADCLPAPTADPGTVGGRFVVDHDAPPNGLYATTLACKVCVPGSTSPHCPQR